MKILMTGSSGFIGSALTPILSKQYELQHLKSDLLDFDAVAQEVAVANPDIIVHLAARTEVEKSFYEQISFSQVNYVGTVNLIESARKLKKLKNFVFASTMEVYGWQPISDEIQHTGKFSKYEVFDEHTIPNPNAPYAVAKLGCEKYLEYAHRSYDLPFTAIRQTNAYGRTDNDFFVTEAIVTRMLKNPSVINMGYAEPWRNFIFIDDLLDAWIKIIANVEKCSNGLICTVGPDNAIRIKDYAQKIATKIGWNGEIKWDQQPKRHGEIYWLNRGCNTLKKLLDWEPQVDMDQGLDRTIEVWNKQLHNV